MTDTEDKFRIYIAHGDESKRRELQEIVEKLGHRVHGLSDSRSKTFEDSVSDPPDLIISGVEFDSGDGIETLIAISEHKPLPAIVVTKRDSLDKVEKAMDDHVMAYMIDPVDADELKPTIYVVLRRFEQLKELEEENQNLKEALASRKKLERAKGILMAKKGWTEEEAYLHLRETATTNRVKLGDVADRVIRAETET